MVDVGDSVENVLKAPRKRGLTSSWLVGGTWRQTLQSFTFPTVSVFGEAKEPTKLPPRYPSSPSQTPPLPPSLTHSLSISSRRSVSCPPPPPPPDSHRPSQSATRLAHLPVHLFRRLLPFFLPLATHAHDVTLNLSAQAPTRATHAHARAHMFVGFVVSLRVHPTVQCCFCCCTWRWISRSTTQGRVCWRPANDARRGRHP